MPTGGGGGKERGSKSKKPIMIEKIWRLETPPFSQWLTSHGDFLENRGSAGAREREHGFRV